MIKRIYTDHHVHTNYSPDSEADIEKYLIDAKDLGHGKVMFTDHVDMGGTDLEFQKLIDYYEYFQLMKNLEEKHEIEIQVGVEIGYEKNYKDEINEFLDKHPFEFVIASTHYGDGKDFYYGDFFLGKSQDEAYRRYFEIVLEMVENFSNFDVVGHLDYIVRYGPFENKSYDYEKYQDLIDPILNAIIRKSKGIEVNTSGLRGELKTTFPKAKVLERYRELGGEIITIGSDAHLNEEYYEGILEGKKTLKALGFKEISSFKKRKATQKKIII